MKIIIICLLTLCLAADADAFDAKSVQIHGFVSQGYLISDQNNYYFSDTEDGTFQFNETGINFTTEPADNLRLGLQLLSRDLGKFGNNEIEIDWAFGDYRFRNWLGLRAGKIRLAFGLHNQTRDIDAARACIFLPPAMYNDVYRGTLKSITGVGLYGLLPAGFAYQIQFGKMEIDGDGPVGESFKKSSAQSVDIETEDDTYSLHLEWEAPLDGLKIGGSYLGNLSWTTTASGIVSEADIDIVLISMEYQSHGLSISGEYIRNNSKIAGVEHLATDTASEGYYGMLTYRLTDWFESGFYYSVFHGNKDDRDGDRFAERGRPRELAWLRDTAVFTRFDISESWVLKLECHYFDGLSSMVVSPTGDDPSDKGFLFAAKTTFSF